MSRLFTIIGDANVRRNMTQLNIASREAMKNSQVIPCDDLPSLDRALSEVRPESSICIVACITEMLLAADNTGTVSSSIDSVLSAVKVKLVAHCTSHLGLKVVVAPPLYRNKPVWYQTSLPQISGLFSSALANDVPANLFLLPSFCSQDLCPDGVYLTAVSGLHYVLHLYDQTDVVIQVVSAPTESQLYRVNELCRHHDDRIVFLEQRHENLDGRFSVKTAADAEFRDWMLNRSEEDWITILGAKRLPEAPTREWQMAAKRFVNDIIKLVLKVNNIRLDYTVLYVHNPIRYRKTGQTVLNVHLDSLASAKRIRELYSGFFRHDSPVKLPASLKGVSLRNKITLESRIRIAILGQLGVNFQASNGPGSSFKVKGYDSRPLLTTVPPSGASGARPRTYTFIEAVSLLPGVFSDESLMRIHQVVGTHHPDQLQRLFVVLRDDDRDRIEGLIKAKFRDRDLPKNPSGAVGAPFSSSGSFSGLGSGMDVQAALLLPPPPPPPQPPRPSSPPPSSRSESRTAVKRSRRHSESESESDSRGRVLKDRSSESSDPPPRKTSKRKRKHRRRRSPSSSSGSSSSSSGPSRSGSSVRSHKKSKKRER